MSDNDKVLVLSTKLAFKNSVPDTLLSEWSSDYFEITEADVQVTSVDWFDKDDFEDAINKLQAFGKRIKNKVKGDILVFVKSEDESVRTGKYKLSTSKNSFEECDLAISVKREVKAKPKQLTENEKIDLFRDYWNEKNKEPSKGEVYKGFRIGTFYASAMKNENVIELLRQIMSEE